MCVWMGVLCVRLQEAAESRVRCGWVKAMNMADRTEHQRSAARRNGTLQLKNKYEVRRGTRMCARRASRVRLWSVFSRVSLSSRGRAVARLELRHRRSLRGSGSAGVATASSTRDYSKM